jgi:Mg/Co/Ni transporter MgtE
MAIFRVVTFLIHAIVAAIASLLTAIFTHVIPAIVAVAAFIALVFAVCTSCGIGSIAVLRKRRRD